MEQVTEIKCPPHSYPKPVFEGDAEKAIVICTTCGKKDHRYRYQYDSNFKPKNRVIKKSNPVSPEQKQEVKVVYIAPQDKDIDLKARFSECLVLLKSAFPDMVEGRVKAAVRRYLSSQGYEQSLKAIGNA